MNYKSKLTGLSIRLNIPGTIKTLICNKFLQRFKLKQIVFSSCINIKHITIAYNNVKNQLKKRVFLLSFSSPLLVYYIDLIHPKVKKARD